MRMNVSDYDRNQIGVDCDIHVGYEALSDLYPYLCAQTRDLLQNSATFGFTMPGYTWQHPDRMDTKILQRDRHRGGADAGFTSSSCARNSWTVTP